MVLKNILLILFALFYIPNAFSLFLIEPYGGIQLGDTTLEEKTSATTLDHDGFNIGVELGARLGLNIGPIMFGTETNHGWISFKTRRQDKNGSITTSSTYNNTLSRTLYGGFIGVNIPVLPFKIWGNYFLATGEMTYAEPTSNNIFSKEDKITGAGWGLGLGLTAVPFINFIVSYRRITYDEWKTGGATITLPNATYTEFVVSEFLAGISIPFDL